MTTRDAQPRSIRSMVLHAALYVLGLGYYAYVLGWGRAQYHMYDWPLFLNSLGVLKAAIAQGALPFHASLFNNGDPHQQTEFFALAHTVLTPPLFPLLLAASVKVAAGGHILLHYSLGYLGLAQLCRHNRIDRLGFSALYAIFLLGGFIPTKLVVGHGYDVPAYFLLPFALVYAQRLLMPGAGDDGRRTVRDAVIKMSLVLVYTALLGALHVLFIELVMLGTLFLWQARTRRALAAIAVLLAWGGAIRFLPMLTMNDAYLGEHRRTWATGGYGSLWADQKPCSVRSPTCWLSDLADALTVLHPIEYHNEALWWEFSLYISLAGALLLMVGLSFVLLHPHQALRLAVPDGANAARQAFTILTGSGLLIFVLSMGPLYRRLLNPICGALNLSQINQLPSRMMIYPLLLFSSYAVVGWQAARRAQATRQWLTAWQAILVAVMVVACLEHAAHWNIASMERYAVPNDQNMWYLRHSPSMEGALLDLPVSSAYRWTVYGALASSIAYLAYAVWSLAVQPVRRGPD